MFIKGALTQTRTHTYHVSKAKLAACHLPHNRPSKWRTHHIHHLMGNNSSYVYSDVCMKTLSVKDTLWVIRPFKLVSLFTLEAYYPTHYITGSHRH